MAPSYDVKPPTTLKEAEDAVRIALTLAPKEPQAAKRIMQMVVAAANQNATLAATPSLRAQWHLQSGLTAAACFTSTGQRDFSLLHATLKSAHAAVEAAPDDSKIAVTVAALVRQIAMRPGAQTALSFAAGIDLKAELNKLLPHLMKFTNNALALVLARELAGLAGNTAARKDAVDELGAFRAEFPRTVDNAEAALREMDAAAAKARPG